MYLVTFYDPEMGDVTNTLPAESFDDAVAAVFDEIGTERGRTVTATADGKTFGLVVMQSDITIAMVADVPYAQAASTHATAEALVEACNSLADGDTGPIAALFTDGQSK